MSAEFTFKDNSLKVKKAIAQACEQWLEEASGELASQTRRRQTRVDTGDTKGSWTHKVISDREAVVGNPLENAIWEEFGTGEYALNGGRKGGWVYKSPKDGKFHRTYGKTPLRPLYKAYNATKGKLKKSMEAKLKGLS